MSRINRYRKPFGTLHPQMEQFIGDLNSTLDQLQAQTGGTGSLPPQPIFNVIGVDGKFLVTITPPQDMLAQTPNQALIQSQNGTNQQGVGILFNLQSATDINFNNASNVSDYGTSSQLFYTFQLPNETLFWRIRSSFDGQNWTDWQVFSSALQCGPVAVSSGQSRSITDAINAATNTTNVATVDSIDAGADATIRVYGPGGVGTSWQRNVGGTMVGPDNTPNTTFPAASILHFSYATVFKVLYDTVNAIYRVFTTAQYQQTLPDGYAFAGTVTTVASGGSGGTSGGGGNTGGGGGNRYFEQ